MKAKIRNRTDTVTVDAVCRPHADGYQPADLTDNEALELTRSVYGSGFELQPAGFRALSGRSRKAAALMASMRGNDLLAKREEEGFRQLTRKRMGAALVLYWSRCATVHSQYTVAGVPGKDAAERMEELSRRFEKYTGKRYSRAMLTAMMRVPERMNAAEAYRLGEHGACESDLIRLASMKDGIKRHGLMQDFMYSVELNGVPMTYREYALSIKPAKEVYGSRCRESIRRHASALLQELQMALGWRKYAKSTLTALKRNIAKALELLK